MSDDLQLREILCRLTAVGENQERPAQTIVAREACASGAMERDRLNRERQNLVAR